MSDFPSTGPTTGSPFHVDRKILRTLHPVNRKFHVAVNLDLDAFGKRLEALRKRAGLTQTQLAEVVGGGTSKISEWESGGRKPDAEGLLRAAVRLGTTVDYLLTGSSGAAEWTRERLTALLADLEAGTWREIPPDQTVRKAPVKDVPRPTRQTKKRGA